MRSSTCVRARSASPALMGLIVRCRIRSTDAHIGGPSSGVKIVGQGVSSPTFHLLTERRRIILASVTEVTRHEQTL